MKKAQFLLGGRIQTGEVLKENLSTVIVRVGNGESSKDIKRHKKKHQVKMLRKERKVRE